MSEISIVYALEYSCDQGDLSFVREIGIFSSERLAQEQLNRCKHDPRYDGDESHFIIDRVELDKEEWGEGFFTYSY